MRRTAGPPGRPDQPWLPQLAAPRETAATAPTGAPKPMPHRAAARSSTSLSRSAAAAFAPMYGSSAE
jgi:hypothetical protein